ncbi:MAG: hypothetical protein V4726_04625 [Verrucomicrobiota bacterium]
MNPNPGEIWSHLATRGAEEKHCAQSADLTAPFGFAGRVVAQWRATPRAEKLRFWRLWTLRGSLAALAALALAAALGNPPPPASAGASVFLEPPSLNLPLP